MRTLLTVLGIALVASLLAYGWLRQDDLEYAQKNFQLTMLVGEKNGYILTPPEFVAQPFIRHIEWSPDGNYAILVQTAVRMDGTVVEPHTEMRHRVLLWNRNTKRVSVLWESSKMEADIDWQRYGQLAFFKDAPACAFVVWEPERLPEGKPLVVYTATVGGRATMVGAFDYVVILSPPEDKARYLVWYEYDEQSRRMEYRYAPLSASGRLGEPRPLPKPLHDISSDTMWHADGKRLIGYELVPTGGSSDDESPDFEAHLFAWNPRTNEISKIVRSELRYYEPKQAKSPTVEPATQRLQHKTAQNATPTTWLVEGDQAALIAADSTLAQVSPKGDGILYVAHGAAFYRSVVTLNADDLRAMAEQAKIRQYTAQGRQIALALLMYAQDYDEAFPLNFGNEGVAEVLLPYLKERSVFEVNGGFAFHYLLNGDNLANIASPMDTVIGYLETPYGRVEIFADGHVKLKRGQ